MVHVIALRQEGFRPIVSHIIQCQERSCLQYNAWKNAKWIALE